MIKKLSEHGDSLAVLIDKTILDLLNINKDTKVRVKTDGKRIIIEPITDKDTNDKDVEDTYNKLAKKYSDTLKKLAE